MPDYDLNLRLIRTKDGLLLFFVTSFEFESEMAICGVGRNMGLGLGLESESDSFTGFWLPASLCLMSAHYNLKKFGTKPVLVDSSSKKRQHLKILDLKAIEQEEDMNFKRDNHLKKLPRI